MFEIIDPLVRGGVELMQNGWSLTAVLSFISLILALILMPFGGKEQVMQRGNRAVEERAQEIELGHRIKYTNYEAMNSLLIFFSWLFWVLANVTIFYVYDLNGFAEDIGIGLYLFLNFAYLMMYPLFFKPMTLKLFGKERSKHWQEYYIFYFFTLDTEEEKDRFSSLFEKKDWSGILESFPKYNTRTIDKSNNPDIDKDRKIIL